MTKLLAYPLSSIYFLCFGLTLLVFHPIQWISFNIFGYGVHKKSVDILNLCLTRCTHILGTRYSFSNPHDIRTDVPSIIVANHQSMSDIPPIIWFMRKYHPKFISKKELGKGIPSVSYNLKYGGSVLIDRKTRSQPSLRSRHLPIISNLISVLRSFSLKGPEAGPGSQKGFKPKGC